LHAIGHYTLFTLVDPIGDPVTRVVHGSQTFCCANWQLVAANNWARVSA
jgi:hypothetical protein